MTKTIVVIVALIGAPRTLGLPALDVNEGHLTSTTPDFERARHKCCLCEGHRLPMDGLQCIVEVDRGGLFAKSCSRACSDAWKSRKTLMANYGCSITSKMTVKSSCTTAAHQKNENPAFEGVNGIDGQEEPWILPCADIVNSRDQWEHLAKVAGLRSHVRHFGRDRRQSLSGQQNFRVGLGSFTGYQL